MIKDIKSYIEKFESRTKDRFYDLNKLIYDSTSQIITEKLWAKLPSYYVGNNFVRIIPFKDHINIEANAVISHKDDLGDYKITPKGMLQIFHNQLIPDEILKVVFKESLE
ncbi:DUF1801 domain-containing protein [Anaerocolumna sp. MB42-C2]|uniref:DUF1801 domain-containing protein n=1 Tax=Anaerocolumna sp. MB42-C2 TaxID=3070997 RepID=UPI0027E1C7D1|nr:DUF1801 domain-containing protein [Anaerocolumna sp. MB42-C2]WMJ87168.1 DUF1801 domain-containing protein [Anaerocolumna sp. MB42-C2]